MSHIQCPECFRVWPEDYDATRCDCQYPIDQCGLVECFKCGTDLQLNDGCEWPETRLFCWGCAVETLDEVSGYLGEYHQALNRREHGGLAADAFIKDCQRLLQQYR